MSDVAVTYLLDVHLVDGVGYPTGDEIALYMKSEVKTQFDIECETWFMEPAAWFLYTLDETVTSISGIEFDVESMSEGVTARYGVFEVKALYDDDDYEDFKVMVSRWGMKKASARWAKLVKGASGLAQARFLALRYEEEES